MIHLTKSLERHFDLAYDSFGSVIVMKSDRVC